MANSAALTVLASIGDADIPTEYQSTQCLLGPLSVILVGLGRVDLGEADLHPLVIHQHRERVAVGDVDDALQGGRGSERRQQCEKL